MPLTTTSGYTIPVQNPTIQNPASGNAYNGTPAPADSKLDSYGSWNGDWLGYLNYMADHGDSASLDKLLNYLMSEQSSQTARDWTAQREDTQYQRLVADLRAAGINPYSLIQGSGSPISSASSGHSYSGTNNVSYELGKEKNAQNWLKVALSGMLPILGAIIAAAL